MRQVARAGGSLLDHEAVYLARSRNVYVSMLPRNGSGPREEAEIVFFFESCGSESLSQGTFA
jgi:hypothetical protein